MNRRKFFGALFTATAAPVVPHRVYSFLWDQPLVRVSAEILDNFTVELYKVESEFYQRHVLNSGTLQEAYDQGGALKIPSEIADLMADSILESAFKESLFPKLLKNA